MKALIRSLAITVLTLQLLACGKRGPLIYPDLLVPAAPAAVSLHQSGAGTQLRFALPATDKAGRKLLDLAGVKISKRIGDTVQGQCPACTSDFKPFVTLYPEALPKGVQRSGNHLFLNDEDVQPSKSYTYRLIPFARDGVEGESAVSTVLTVVQSLPSPKLAAESSPTEIKLSFVDLPPTAGTKIGLNLYRAPIGQPFPFLPLTREPLKGYEYLDSGLERKMVYRYQARTVIRLDNGDLVESLPSDEVTSTLKDDE